MKVLAFGGDGFIGSYFVEHALSRGHEVTVFDRFPYSHSNNLKHLLNQIRFLPGEFANRVDVEGALEGQDIVYHFVSVTNAVTSWENPAIEIEENLKYSVQLFELAVQKGVKKIVFISSGGTVYGPHSGIITENTLPRPFSPYGICKLATEHFLNYFHERHKIATDIYRVGNPYGARQPMQTPQGVIAVWMGKILRGEVINIYGGTDIYRDYVYVEDVAYLLTHSLDDLKKSDTYNVGTARGVSIAELLEIFLATIDESVKYKVFPKRGLDNTSVILDSSKLVAFFPDFTFQRLENKIPETWADIKERHLGHIGKE